MKIYYIRHHDESLGPYSKQELRLVGIKPDDYIWTGGLGGWKQAKDLQDLKDILVTSIIEPIGIKNKSKKTTAPQPHFNFRNIFSFLLRRVRVEKTIR